MEPTTLPELCKLWPGLSREQIIWKALNAGLVVVKAKGGPKVDEAARLYKQKAAASRRAMRMKTREERAAEMAAIASRRAARIKTQAERAVKMAALRPEHTHKQIGERWGITRERVRQILRAHGYDDLLPHPRPRIEKICPQCGSNFGAKMGIRQAETQKFCGTKCFSAHASSHMTDREREVVTATLKLRSEGKKWREVAKTLGFASSNPGTGLSHYIKKNAAKENIDVSAAFGFTGR